MTLLDKAKQGLVSDEMKRVASDEDVAPDLIRERMAAGRLVIPCNRRRRASSLCGIGEGLRTKVNANIGTSHDYADVSNELAKLDAAVQAGADTVMDLSTGGDIPAIRQRVIDASAVGVGTVPIYDAAVTHARDGQGIRGMSARDMFDAVRHHCEDGVDFVTVHCGVTRDVVRSLKSQPRVCGVVSRGGTFLAHWMHYHKQENPLYERYDELLDILRENDVTISLGDGMRPGALADAFDRAQVHELNVIAGLAQRALDAGVQVIVEGPGHVPIHQIEAQVRLEKELCRGAPFYVLGPIVTDVAPGYDHITAAIGGAIAASAGADFLCYVTESEHLALPTPPQVRQGVIAARIAAHAGDVAKRGEPAMAWDRSLSQLRRERDWDGQIENALDPERAAALRKQRSPENGKVCSMCGEFCVFKVLDEEGI